MTNGEVKHGRGAKADIDCVDAGGIQALDYKIVIGVRAQAAVTPDGHVLNSMACGIGSYGPAQVENEFFV